MKVFIWFSFACIYLSVWYSYLVFYQNAYKLNKPSINLIVSLIHQPSSMPRRLLGKSVFLHSFHPYCRDYILFHSHGQCQVVLGNTIILCMCCPHQIIYFWEPGGRTDTNAYEGILHYWSIDRLSKVIIYKMELSDNNYN